MFRSDAQALRNPVCKARRLLALFSPGLCGVFFCGGRNSPDERRIFPDRLAVLAPVKRQRPARQRFPGIPFSLTVMQHSARRETLAEFADQLICKLPFGWTNGVNVPLTRLKVSCRNERRFAAHRQTHILRNKVGVHLFAEAVQRRPGVIIERRGDARRLSHARDCHGEMKIDISGIN